MDELLPQRIATAVEKVRLATPTSEDFAVSLHKPITTGLSSWEFWVLVALLRHERRQKWVGYIVESKLRGSGNALAKSGAFAHPEDMEQSGDVPDNPPWKYFFHGRGCCLTHSDGTSIDVDFADDGSAQEIDPYFFSNFLSSVPCLEWSEAQLRLPAPFAHVWQYELSHLTSLQLVQRKWRFRLFSSGRELAEQLEPLVDEVNRLASNRSTDNRTKMSWLLTTIGDFRSAKEILASHSSDLGRLLANAARLQVDERAKSLRRSLASPNDNDRKLALATLATLGREYAEQEVQREFERMPPASSHYLCLDIMDTWNDRTILPVLIATLKRFAPRPGIFASVFRKTIPEKDEVERPRNGLVVAICKRLLGLHTPSTMPSEMKALILRVLGTDRKACDAEASFMLYLLSPAAGLKRIVANCQNQVPMTREEAALFLSMIGTEEAIDALVAVANGSPENGGHEAACALAESENPRAKHAAADWSRRNDGYEEAEGSQIEYNGRIMKVWKMDEVMRSNMRETMKDWSKRLDREYAPMLSVWSGE